jgi:formylglycine-generating enzyme required for sulfatase activity
LEIEAALKRDIVVMPVLVQEAHMPTADQLPPEIKDLAYRNGFELSHTRWESDIGEMMRRLGLDAPQSGEMQQSASPAGPPSTAPTARLAEQRRVLFRRINVTRRQALGIAALAAVGSGVAITAPSIRRFLSKPALRTIGFDTVTVDAKGVRNPPEEYTAQLFTEGLGLGAWLDMVLIPGGSFTMGSPVDELERQANEGPQHHVTLAAFFMSGAPITQAQWTAAVLAHPKPIHLNLDPNPAFFKGIDLPVESITWNQAQEFCLRLAGLTGRGYRLPSEAEWEYACRAGTISPLHFGPTITPELANYCGTGGAVCGESDGKSIVSDVYGEAKYTSGAYGQGPIGVFRGKTTRPGTFPRNRFGLYDMHGNVWEYCLDLWSANYVEAPADGSAKEGLNKELRVDIRH